MQGSLFACINAGSVARARRRDRIPQAPGDDADAARALLIGQLGGVMVVAFVSALIYLAVGFAAGMDFKAGRSACRALLVLALLIALAFAALGAFVGLRSGSGEAVQGFFPLFFVLLFLSSMSLPRPLIEQDWFRIDRDLQPGLLPGRGHALASSSPAGTPRRWRSASGSRSRSRWSRVAAASTRPADEAGADMRRFFAASRAPSPGARSTRSPRTRRSCCRRSCSRCSSSSPSPAACRTSATCPGFDFPSGYTAFQFVFVLLQASAFGGVFTGFGIAAEIVPFVAYKKVSPRRLIDLSGPKRGKPPVRIPESGGP